MSVEVHSQEVGAFLGQAVSLGLVVVNGRLDQARFTTPATSDIGISLERGNRDLVFLTGNRTATGRLFVYALEKGDTLRLGIVPFTNGLSPLRIYLSEQASGREDWHLYAPNAPIPESLYPKLEHPEIQDALISSIHLTYDSIEERSRGKSTGGMGGMFK